MGQDTLLLAKEAAPVDIIREKKKHPTNSQRDFPEVTMTPVGLAVYAEDYKLLKTLARRKPDVNRELWNNGAVWELCCFRTVMDLALQKGNPDIIKLLVKMGADLNKYISDPKGHYLCVVARDGNASIAKLLVEL